jgi:S-adenosylmethionine-diacylgycerolhomoserine-N-methlytransferase
MKTSHKDSNEQASSMEQYYRFQSKIYDMTRWSFLFGRSEVIKDIPIERNAEVRILEVGCGTGFNTKLLAQTFPNAEINAYEVSEDMVNLSRKKTETFGDRVKIVHQPYGSDPEALLNTYDAVLFSYSLTMINPQWEDLIRQAHKDLKVGGYIAVVDFHDSKFNWFKKHMGNNHVRMDSHLQPLLEELFEPIVNDVKNAYTGVWEYLLYVGKKTAE